MAVTLYRQVGKGKDRRYQKVNLGRGLPLPSQGQEEKEVRQGQIHSDPSKADMEDQGQNARAECPAARSRVSE